MEKKKTVFSPSSKIIFRYCLITIAIAIIVAIVMPILLNYPPESINTPFDIQMSYIAYYQQIGLVFLFGIAVISSFVRILLSDIDKWYNLPVEDRFKDDDFIYRIRRKCINLPYTLFLTELLAPIIVGVILLLATGSHDTIMIYKILFILISLALFLSVVSYVFSKDIYTSILSSTYKENANIGFRLSIKPKFFMQIIPLFLIVLFITSLVGYSRIVSEKGDLLFNFYSSSLSKVFDTNYKYYTESEIIEALNSIELYDKTNHRWFIIKPDNSVLVSNGSELSNFIIEYTKQISPSINGKTYGSYGVDTQGDSLIIDTPSGIYYVGILFDVTSSESLSYLIVNFVFLLSIVCIVLYIVVNSTAKDISSISTGFLNIANNPENIENVVRLPITSNDEIGDLVQSFNKVQKLTLANIEQIHDNQDMLVEKERLASLGQMIGGIAHNLKTPIMSIAGAAEGLNDLIKEYDSSIEDSDVTASDHHDIAKDMKVWVDKVKDYTGYMSDVITAVKGQAVALSKEDASSFTIDELEKRINILMKHELQNALVTLNTKVDVNPDIELKGNVSSLVQVVNNMLSNAIQSYEGASGKSIDMRIYKEVNNIVIAIKDYGPGLPEIVKEQLFKEMITTKGKDRNRSSDYLCHIQI